MPLTRESSLVQTFPYFYHLVKQSHRFVLFESSLTHTYNAKIFRRIIAINKRGLAEIIVPFRGYGRLSPNQVLNKRGLLTDKFLLSFS